MSGNAKTIVEYFAEHERYKCGYCGTQDSNYSHGMWAHSLTVQDYQDLLDRGWRRSGKYVYKPTMDKTCCPQYTIRCEVLNFTMRKSQKKAIKKVNKYLIHGIKPSSDKDEEEDCDMTNDDQSKTGSDVSKEEVLNQSGESKESSTQESSQGDSGDSKANQEKSKKAPQPGAGADPNKPKCKKAKELRKERKLAKLAAKQGTSCQTQTASDSKPSKPQGKSLEELLDEPNKAEKCAHKLEASDSKPSKPQGKSLEELLDEPNKAEKCAHKLEIRLLRSEPRSQEFKDSLEESHKIYHSYQMSIHNDAPDKPSMKQFTRFLIDSPLEEEKGDLPAGYGSFHQQYLLDGKIICVGVIDILPNLVSSKYLYYDPDYSFLGLGTYSALREVAFVRALNKHSSEMKYYYMGFYIHSCPKMKYKGQYYPSFLLCPETYTWNAVEKCAPMLDQKTYCRFADKSKKDVHGIVDLDAVLILFMRQMMTYNTYKMLKDVNGVVDLDAVLVLYMRQMMTYTIYKMLSKDTNHDEDEVREYAGFVGRKCYTRMMLFRN